MKKFIEIHLLKNYNCSNLNRDSGGSPKMLLIGGCKRGRISSQCLKSHLRKDFKNYNISGVNASSFRTRYITKLVLNILEQEPNYETSYKKFSSEINKILKSSSSSKKSNNKENEDENKKNSKKDTDKIEPSATIVHYTQEEVNELTKVIKDYIDEHGDLKDFKLDTIFKDKSFGITLDDALFGRMVTDKMLTPVDATMQVAHAFSTNKLCAESDFFVAMDDLVTSGMIDEQTIGAAQLGDVEYNSSCYYEYFNLDIEGLKKNLKVLDDSTIKEVIEALLKSIIMLNPSGKQNTFASYPEASFIMVEMKDEKIASTYSNAFNKVVTGEDIVESSIDRLVKYVDRYDEAYDRRHQKFVFIYNNELKAPKLSAVSHTINDLINNIMLNL